MYNATLYYIESKFFATVREMPANSLFQLNRNNFAMPYWIYSDTKQLLRDGTKR